MNTLITCEEVVRLAFTDGEYVSSDAISAADIAAAGHRYIEPVVGKSLYAMLPDGEYASLKTDYVAPALAMAVRVLVQRSLNVRSGQSGLTVPKGTWSAAASSDAADELQRSLRRRLRLLLERLSDHLAENAASYPEYDPSADAVKHCSLNGGFVQIR